MLIDWINSNGLPMLNLGSFMSRLAVCLPSLLDFMASDELRRHPVWGKRLPFDVLPYGEGRSLGHCIRPDVIISPEGPRICEFDFVASGRGFGFSAFPEGDPRGLAYMQAFADWYRAMDVGQVRYATATTTTCWAETVLFSEALKRLCGVDIEAVNIDEAPVNGALIDRLFYRSEMLHPERAQGRRIITQEPHLDSKMVFALVHDPGMTGSLEAAIGPENLAFLRTVFPESYCLDNLRAQRRDFLMSLLGQGEDGLAARKGWLIKNTDVESNECWGTRGVIMGRKLKEKEWRAALMDGINPGGKYMGRRPILQRFHTSVDFRPIWDAIVRGQVHSSDRMGYEADPMTREFASQNVTARVGAYLLISNDDRSVHVPPYGILTLCQNSMAHGNSQANFTAFGIAHSGS